MIHRILDLFSAPSRAEPFSLDEPLLRFGSEVWSQRDAESGTLVLGATGSGKSTGSSRLIARALLRAQCGGLVLCVKPDEPDIWRQYARETGREKDIVSFGPGHPARFNFLDYELKQAPTGTRPTENLVRVFTDALEVSERGQRSKTTADFWDRSLKQLLRNSIELVTLAKDSLSLKDLYELVMSAPLTPEDVQSRAWQQTSFCMALIREARAKSHDALAQHDLELTASFFLREFPNLSSRTRSCVVAMFSSLADGLARGQLHLLLGTNTTITPEDSHHGKIILMDLPTKVFHETASVAQAIWKFIWQRAAERRDVRANPRPCFLFADECHAFLTSSDIPFQLTARSSRVATVLVSQSLPTFTAALGKNESEVLLGNLATKIFHQQSCPQTCEWASATISKSYQFRAVSSTTRSGGGWGGERVSRNSSGAEHLEFEVLPGTFTTLRRGGPENRGCIDAIVHTARPWHQTGKNYLRVTFKQDMA